ncbi:MAG: NAD(P)H-dependent oxidoreductase [Deltaproteobacteria bacterium]|nr:NAD(P)H-dependent oxidoreductase [Deltaproteobacteria bacterium]
MSNERPFSPRVLCIYGSPRVRGNTDLLLDAFADGVEEAGGLAERVYLRNLTISPCREIYACKTQGACALKDDMQPLYGSLREADAIALASPVMFYGVSAHAKAFIDRCQAFWCLKYLRGERISRSRLAERKGVFLSVGGSKGRSIFDGPLLTFRYFLDALDATPWKSLTYREIDAKDDISGHPTALAEARALGAELVAAVRADLEGEGAAA